MLIISENFGILIIILICFFIYLDRKNIKREGILFIRRSVFLVEKIEKIGKRFKKFFSIYGLISLIACFILLFIGYFLILKYIEQKIKGEVKDQIGLKFVLPELPVVKELPFVFSLNPFYFLPIIFLIALFHEISHAFVCASQKVKIKSIGYAFLIFLPAFFVEPNEKKLKKAKTIEKLKIYAAGSFGNLILAAISFLLIYFLFLFFEPYGIEYKVQENTPAYYANLTGIILYINENRIKTLEDLVKVIKTEFKENKTIKVITTSGTFNITLKKINESIRMGIYDVKVAYIAKINFLEPIKNEIFTFIDFLNWLFIISIAVAIFNVLPIKILDGGQIIEESLKYFLKKKGEKIFNVIQMITIFLLILVAIPLRF